MRPMVLRFDIPYAGYVVEVMGNNIEVDWGDGTVDSDNYHGYDEPGLYEAKVYGGGGSGIGLHDIDALIEVVDFGTYGAVEFVFSDCRGLKKVPEDLPDSVVSAAYMFSGCSSLTDISALSGWDVSSVTNMSNMFSFCSSLTDISALASWDTSSVTNMTYMFYGCSSLTTGDLSGWCVSNIPTEPLGFRDGTSNWNGPFPVWGTCPPPKPTYYGPNMLEADTPNWVCGKAPNALEAGAPNSLKAGTPNLLVTQGQNLLVASHPNTLLAHVPNDLKAPEPNTLEATEPNLVVPQGFAVLRG